MTDDEIDMISALEVDHVEQLTDEEADFLEEICDHDTLTPEQKTRLEQIFARVKKDDGDEG